jgi:hypothetical protein
MVCGGRIISICRRQSGDFGIYVNEKCVDSAKRQGLFLDDVEITFNNIYFLLHDTEGKKIIRKKAIDNEIIFAKAEDVSEKDLQSNLYDKVQRWYNIYRGSYLEFNGIHLGHGPFVSHFSLSLRTMVKMTKFEHNLHRVFETVERNDDGLFMTFGVLLENGDIFDAMRDDITNPDIKIKDKTEPDFQIDC